MSNIGRLTHDIRSVHNIRIERLWYDFTAAVGSKWKAFFVSLEVSEGLNVDNPSHIWLLHFLFLDAINRDATLWANTWNNHRMNIPDQGHVTPADMRWFSMLHHGTVGFEPGSPASYIPPADVVTEDDIAEYGVDWDTLDDRRYQSHHREANPPDLLGDNPFLSHEPEEFSAVDVEEPRCPFSPEQLSYLQRRLEPYIVLDATMEERKILWTSALTICISEMQWAP